MLSIISSNGIATFSGCIPRNTWICGYVIAWLDFGFLLYFIAEIIIKLRHWGSFRKYAADAWNLSHFIIVALSTPAFLNLFFSIGAENVMMITVLRVTRSLIGPLRLFPDAGHIFRGVFRALHPHWGFFLILVFLNVLLSLTATLLFGGIPETKEFSGNPSHSIFLLLEIFTIE